MARVPHRAVYIIAAASRVENDAQQTSPVNLPDSCRILFPSKMCLFCQISISSIDRAGIICPVYPLKWVVVRVLFGNAPASSIIND